MFENKSRDYHYNKFNECRKKDILLITIFDIELKQKEEEIKQYIREILEGKENSLSYNKDGYMNNDYPSWKYYKNVGKYVEESYTLNKCKVYTCGYSKIEPISYWFMLVDLNSFSF